MLLFTMLINASSSSAASNQGSWSLLYNPLLPPGSSITYSEAAFVPSTKSGTVYVDRFSTDANNEIWVMVKNIESNYHKYSSTAAYSIKTLVKGTTQYTSQRIKLNTSKYTSAGGHIKA